MAQSGTRDVTRRLKVGVAGGGVGVLHVKAFTALP